MTLIPLGGYHPAMKCGRCGHEYPDRTNGRLYTCPACNAGPPYTSTIYPHRDEDGNIISHSTLERLRELKVEHADVKTREEVLVDIVARKEP